LTELSDRNAKTNIRELDRDDVLQRVARLPISRWQYKKDDGVDHIGPMAQDFHVEFGLGNSETHIGTIDTVGVALAAIQGLLEKQTALEAENQQLKESQRQLLAAYHRQQESMRRVDGLEQAVTELLDRRARDELLLTSIK